MVVWICLLLPSFPLELLSCLRDLLGFARNRQDRVESVVKMEFLHDRLDLAGIFMFCAHL